MPSQWCQSPSSKKKQVKSPTRTKGGRAGRSSGTRGRRSNDGFLRRSYGLQVGKSRSSDLFSIDDELIGDHQAPQAITVTLHPPNLGLNTNLAPNPVSLLNCAPPANTERQPIRDSHGITAKVVRASFTIPPLRGSIVGLSRYLNIPAGPTKRNKHANSETIPQQLPSRVPIPHTTSSQICSINILDLSSCGINLYSDCLDITTSETTAFEPERIRACRFTPATHQPEGPEPPQLASLRAQSARETSSPFAPA